MEVPKAMANNYGEYPSILNVFKRNRNTGKIIPGDWACPEFGYLRNCQWDFCEKIDGMNIRVIFENGKMSKRGRTDRVQLPVSLSDELDRLFLPHMEHFRSESLCFYGEGYGGKIQKGEKYQIEQRFILFDVKVGKNYLRRATVQNLANSMKIRTVPIRWCGTLLSAIEAIEHGCYSRWSEHPAAFFVEGLVGRPVVPLYSQWGERIQVKIKTRDFSPAYAENSA